MRVIAPKTLEEFWEKPGHKDSEGPLKAWLSEAKEAKWGSPSDIKKRYPSASIIPDNRMVFNIGGNKYILIAHINYNKHILCIKFIGTHAEYDKVDAEKV